MVAHVGDSRIYLIRQGKIQQLSEDHSLVAMLVANGEITEEESLTHPDRNVLLKSIGSKKHLSEGYVQNLSRTTSNLSMTLENEDILLLCSDGVWDLVPTQELAEIFSQFESLQMAVDQTIQRVINKGATDNATLLAMQCFMTSGT
jgi:protein phosphatase